MNIPSKELEWYRAILRKVLETDDVERFFDIVVWGGGSVTIDAQTGELVYITEQQIDQL